MTLVEKIWEYAQHHPPVVADQYDSGKYISIMRISRFRTKNNDFLYEALLHVETTPPLVDSSNKPRIASLHLIEDDQGEVFEPPEIIISEDWFPPQKG